MWNIFLTDFKFHLEAKSWLDITYIGINENPMEETLAAINVVRNHDKCWKITYAGNWHKELDGLLDDYSSFTERNLPSPSKRHGPPPDARPPYTYAVTRRSRTTSCSHLLSRDVGSVGM